MTKQGWQKFCRHFISYIIVLILLNSYTPDKGDEWNVKKGVSMQIGHGLWNWCLHQGSGNQHMVYTPTLHNYIKTLYTAKYYVDGHHHVCALCARHVTYMHIGEAGWSSRSIKSCDFQGKSLYALSGSTRETTTWTSTPPQQIFFHTLQCRPDFMVGVESLCWGYKGAKPQYPQANQ